MSIISGSPSPSDKNPTSDLDDRSEADLDSTLEQSIRAGREFSLAEVIGREAGDFLKGESPIPLLEQTKHAIQVFIEAQLPDPEGVLKMVLQEWINDEVRLDRYGANPLGALAEQLEEVLAHPNLLYELVRQVDVKWGELNQERPHFQRPSQQPDSEDPYTHESVQQALNQLLSQVPTG
jgi:hypothetical protein